MNLRFISWNIHGKKHVSPLLDLLQKYAGDLVALQEVTVPAYQELVESKLFAWSAFSLDLRPPQVDEGRGRRLGCALLGQAPFLFKHAFLLEQAPLPEDHSYMAESGQTHGAPASQRDALESILDRRRRDTASRMASTSKAIKERGSMMYSRKWPWLPTP